MIEAEYPFAALAAGLYATVWETLYFSEAMSKPTTQKVHHLLPLSRTLRKDLHLPQTQHCKVCTSDSKIRRDYHMLSHIHL